MRRFSDPGGKLIDEDEYPRIPLGSDGLFSRFHAEAILILFVPVSVTGAVAGAVTSFGGSLRVDSLESILAGVEEDREIRALSVGAVAVETLDGVEIVSTLWCKTASDGR